MQHPEILGHSSIVSLLSKQPITFETASQTDVDSINKALGVISFVLFILGNVLLFYPLPSEQDTCYHSAPMLWWGTMAVTGVGWFLIGQVLFVVAVVGIGGHAVLVSLSYLQPPLP